MKKSIERKRNNFSPPELGPYLNIKQETRELLREFLRAHHNKRGFSLQSVDFNQGYPVQMPGDPCLEIRSIIKKSSSKESISQFSSKVLSMIRFKKLERNTPSPGIEGAKIQENQPLMVFRKLECVVKDRQKNYLTEKQKSNLLYTGLPFIPNPARNLANKSYGDKINIMKKDDKKDITMYSLNKNKILGKQVISSANFVNNYMTQYLKAKEIHYPTNNTNTPLLNKVISRPPETDPRNSNDHSIVVTSAGHSKKPSLSEPPVLKLPICVPAAKSASKNTPLKTIDIVKPEKRLILGIVGQKAVKPEKYKAKTQDEEVKRSFIKEDSNIGNQNANNILEILNSPVILAEEPENEEESFINEILADNNEDKVNPINEKIMKSEQDLLDKKDKIQNIEETPEEKSKGRVPNWIITPSNLSEQESAFFASGCKINPQFTYENPKMASRMLRLFQKPKGNLLELAIKVIEKFVLEYKSETQFFAEFGGEIINVDQAKDIFNEYIKELGIEEFISLKFSYNTVSNATTTHEAQTGKSVLTLGLPMDYRRKQFLDMLNHEIGTHFLRKYNDRFQSWHGARKKNNLKNYIATEEGLASLNQIYEHVFL